MLRDRVLKYYDKKYDLNCSEAILYASNEEFKLNLPKNAMKMMAAFGGGMAIESICGGATGAIAVIGILFTNDRGHESPKVRELTYEFMNRFKEALGTDKCDELKLKFKTPEKRCLDMMLNAADTLEHLINREKDNIKFIN